MVVSRRKMSAGAGYMYLLKTVVAGDGDRSRSTPLTRYYAETGTPPGRWMGSGVRDLGLEVGTEVTETVRAGHAPTPHVAPALRVKAGGRLVEEHHFGTPHHRAGEVEASVFAAGEPDDAGPGAILEPQRAEQVGDGLGWLTVLCHMGSVSTTVRSPEEPLRCSRIPIRDRSAARSASGSSPSTRILLRG